MAFRARKVIGTFEKPATGDVSTLVPNPSVFPLFTSMHLPNQWTTKGFKFKNRDEDASPTNLWSPIDCSIISIYRYNFMRKLSFYRKIEAVKDEKISNALSVSEL